MVKIKGKRAAALPAQARPEKKRKVEDKKARTVPKKEKASERKLIPIPALDHLDSGASDVGEEDVEYFRDVQNTGGFLNTLDEKGIARSKHETDRLKKLSKSVRAKVIDDDLPSIHSHDDDDELWNSDIPAQDSSEDDDTVESDQDSVASSSSHALRPLNVEQPYELQPRLIKKLANDEDGIKGSERLPVKLADGTIKKRGNLPAPIQDSDHEEDSDRDESSNPARGRKFETGVEDVATGARFGRPAVAAVIGDKSRKARIQGAKEQLASICSEIVADPENSLGLLRRLHSFALSSISTPSQPKPVPNDPLVRKLAFLSQLAVFKDVVPGYRIRPLTDKEKAEKVSQMVQRTRDFEQGLVGVYQSYLTVLEEEIKAKSELAETALQCMCILLTELTHFNYRLNLMSAVIARLSKKSWDESSQLCLDTLNTVLRQDNTGEASLEVVRLLNRMVKERRFNVHPNVLSCLLNLRLKSELGGVRGSDSKAEKEDDQTKHQKNNGKNRKGKTKFNAQPHLSKNAKKALKENKEIEEEMREAEAEINREERSKTHTETLKLLFVLYFRILKNPIPTPLLPGALEGISRFAHLVNIDFFKDLLAVLKTLVLRETGGEDEEDEDAEDAPDTSALKTEEALRRRLLCIVTAFELLSGQGEALMIDLGDFVNFLYVIIIELSLETSIEDAPQSTKTTSRKGVNATMADLLFRALNLVFMKRSSAGNNPPWRSAAFAKRLLIASIQWPPATALRALDFVQGLIVKEPALEALLSTEDRVTDGLYKADSDDPQLCNAFATSFWELRMLERTHWDAGVRTAAGKIANFRR